ncbi:R-spondin-3-like [Poeciliopsis prolifica]|uniref:R-spondin-3-like n=1 Tax=Poeciliopsis prolifica TaxID=188132 RepID=UPI00241382E7|nr:R-spondin-3-like [Poeciliopsis prolifica]
MNLRRRKMQIPALIWMLQLLNVAKGPDSTSVVRFKRSDPAGSGCQVGCATCSLLNGCLSCKPRFFFHLELDGIQQRGTCMSSCPRGHYGMRSPHISTCIKCKVDCASCFSENFCTRCHPGHFLFRGKCESSCPNGLTANAALRECTECPEGCELCVGRNNCTRCRADMYLLHGQCNHTCPKGFEPDVQLMQCMSQVHCEVGEWTSWSQCVRKQNTTVHRRGEETRTRQILHFPSASGDPCPHVSEIRKCATKKKQKGRSE